MQIRDVAVRVVPFSSGTWLDESRVSTPMSWYPEFAERRSSWRGPGSDLVWVHVTTDDPAVFGIGQSRGGAVTAALIEHHFRELLIGADALQVQARTERLRRAALPYAMGGILAMGLSAVELALWDLTARAAGLPLFALLGGDDAALPYYLTCGAPEVLGDLDPAFVAGAATVKVPMQYGPADGRDGARRNLERVAQVRDRLPDGLGVSVDCFMSWDVPYATRFARDAAGLGLDWIEEPLMPDDAPGYAELRRRVHPVRIAGGEHLYSVRDALRFVDEGCVDVLQLDVTWCGGIAVAQAGGAAAVARGLVFAPHGAAMHPWAVHLLAAAGPGTLAEVLVGVDGAPAVPRPSTGPGVGIDPASVGFG